jgi:hypothetical protein
VKRRNKQTNDTFKMFGDFYAISKRIKRKHQEDKVFFPKRYTVPREGYNIDKETSEKERGIVFYVPKDEDYFDPYCRTLIDNHSERDKAARIIDRVHGVKLLRNPARFCVLPESETVEIEIPLTKYENDYYKEVVVQEIGHVAWHKATFYVDKKVYEESLVEVTVKQVLQKLDSTSRPRWKPKTRYWDQDYRGTLEVPGTIFCSEKDLIKKVKKYFKWQGYTPEIVHTKDVSHTVRDNIGCSVFRRHQPPRWTYNRTAEDEEGDAIWNGLESRNQWVFQSLYTIWAGEAAVPGSEYRERVYYAGPARHFNRDEYFNEVFNCYEEPYCQEIVADFQEEEEEPVQVEVVDEEAEAW